MRLQSQRAAAVLRADLDSSGQASLAEEEAGHLVRVLRLGAGAEIDVFDGRGGMFRAKVVEAAGASVRVADRRSLRRPRRSRALRVTLVMSVLKGDKMDDVVRDAVMMGVAAIQPVVVGAQRGQPGRASARRIVPTRWQRIAVAVGEAVRTRGWCRLSRNRSSSTAWIASRSPEPGAGAAGAGCRHGDEPLRDCDTLGSPSSCWSVPKADGQAGSSPRSKQPGSDAVSLGARTLRADAAPLVAMAALFEAWEAW